MAITYLGGKIHKRPGSTSTVSVSLTDLAAVGGGSVSLQDGDLIVVGYAIGAIANINVAVTTGYTEETDLYANGTQYDANLGVFTKFMGPTPDTTVTLGAMASANNSGVATIRAYRGVDPTTPLDVAIQTATGTGTGLPDPPSATPVTSGALAYVIGAQAAALMANLASSDLSDFATDWQSDSQDVGIGVGHISWSGGAIDPAVFTGGSTNASNSWAAATMVLRPASSGDILTPGLLTNSQTFYGPAVVPGAVALSPPLTTNSQTFYSPVVSQGQTLSPPLLVNAQTFYGPTVVRGAISLLPPLLANAQTFYGPTMSVGAVQIAPSLVTNAQTFYAPTVIAGAEVLSPPLLVNAQSFYGPTVSAGAVTLLPNPLANGQVFYGAIVDAGSVSLTPDLLVNDQTFYDPIVTVAGGSQFLLPELFTNDNEFFGATVTPVVRPSFIGGGGVTPVRRKIPGQDHEKNRQEIIERVLNSLEPKPKKKKKRAERPEISPSSILTDIERVEVQLAVIEMQRRLNDLEQQEEEAVLLLLAA